MRADNAVTVCDLRILVEEILPEERTCHLDRGYDSTVTRQLLDEPGFDGQIAR